MEHAYFHLLQLLAGHPAGSLMVIFLAAFLEAIAVIGTFIPGSTAIFVAGALVGTGALSLGWVLACTIAGAVTGDGISYWLGSRYKARIVHVWPIRIPQERRCSGTCCRHARARRDVRRERVDPGSRRIEVKQWRADKTRTFDDVIARVRNWVQHPEPKRLSVVLRGGPGKANRGEDRRPGRGPC